MKKENYTKIKKEIESKIKNRSEKDIFGLGFSWLKYLAVYFAVVTGCRPSEAAHVIYYKTIGINDFTLNKRWGPIDNAAKMDTTSKTRKDYIWLIP